MSTFDEVTSLITDGTHHSPQTSESGDYLYLTSKNIRQNYLDLSTAGYVDAAIHREIYKRCPVKKGDVLLTKDGANTGLAAENNLEEEFSLLSSVALLRPKEGVLSSRYLVHWINSPMGQRLMIQNMSGSAIRRLILAEIKRKEIPLPPLSDQKRITDILDKADAIHRKRQEAVESLDAMRQAVLYDTVLNSKKRDGWREEMLGDISDVKGGIALSSRRDELERKAPYLRVANVYRDRLDLVEIKKVGLTNAEFERTKLLVGDVLIVEGHGNRDEIGRSAIWDGSIQECVHQNHLIRVRPNESIIRSVYLSAFINSPLGRRQLFRFGKTTSGLNTISLSNVRNTVILLPPLALQQRMEQVIAETTHLLTPLNSAFSHATDLFNSLVQRAFKGEL